MLSYRDALQNNNSTNATANANANVNVNANVNANVNVNVNVKASNPIPALTAFFRRAKLNKHDEKAKLTAKDYVDLGFILSNSHYHDFIGFSLSNLLQGIVHKHGTWDDLKKNKLAESLVQAIFDHFDSFNDRDFGTIFRSLSQLKMDKKEFLDSPFGERFMNGIAKHSSASDMWGLSLIFMALVSFELDWEQIKARNLDKILLKSLINRIGDLDKVSASNLLWSFAHLDVPWETIHEMGLDKHLLAEAETIIPTAELTLLNQIQQAKLWYEFELEGDTEATLEKRLKNMAKPKSSEFHREIAYRISLLTDEVFEIEKCYNLVLFVDLGCGKKALEINGPCHEDYLLLDAFKAKLLKKAGVTVEYIDYKDDITDDYLKQKLLNLGIKLKDPKASYRARSTSTIFKDVVPAPDLIRDDRGIHTIDTIANDPKIDGETVVPVNQAKEEDSVPMQEIKSEPEVSGPQEPIEEKVISSFTNNEHSQVADEKKEKDANPEPQIEANETQTKKKKKPKKKKKKNKIDQAALVPSEDKEADNKKDDTEKSANSITNNDTSAELIVSQEASKASKNLGKSCMQFGLFATIAVGTAATIYQLSANSQLLPK